MINLKQWWLVLCLFGQAVIADTISLIDDNNQLVELASPAKKIISLSPHLTELVFDAGAEQYLIATVEYANYPLAAKKIPRVGSFKAWDLERIISLKPDVILVWLSGGNQRQIQKLYELGFNVYVSEPRHLKDISRTIRHIGKMSSTQEIAELAAFHFDNGIEHLSDKFKNASPVKIFYQVWESPLITVNGSQLMSQVFNLCGGINIFSSAITLAPVISREALINKDPDIIIGGARTEDKAHWMIEWKKWTEMKAVKNNHLYYVDPDLLNRQTTRMLKGAEKVCELFDKVRQYND